jgi:hypothetical protein
MSTKKNWISVAEVRRASNRAKHMFFNARVIYKYQQRISSKLYGGKYVVVSMIFPIDYERFGSEAARHYNVYRVNDNATLSLIGSGDLRAMSGPNGAREAHRMAEELGNGTKGAKNGGRLVNA